MTSPFSKDIMTLTGHKDSVNVLRFSADGERLLSGDQAGFIKVWDLGHGTHMQTIDATNFGPVTVIIWIRLPLAHNDGEATAFAVGFGIGTIAIWTSEESRGRFEFLKVIEAHEGPVEALAFDNVHFRLASAGAGHPQVWSLVSSSLLTRLSPEPTKVNPYICSGVHFSEAGQSLLVTYAETHTVLKFQVDPWKFRLINTTQTRIGCSVLEGDALFVSNLKNGTDLYSAETLQRLRHFEYVPKINVIFQICLARQTLDWVVMGGDDGSVRIFDRNTAELLFRLEHGSGGLVQTLDAASIHDQDMIAAAASEVGRASDIKVWYTRKQPRHTQRLYPETSLTLKRCLVIAIYIFSIATIALLFFAAFYYSVFLRYILPALQSRSNP